jgi:dienelactone hydrolase
VLGIVLLAVAVVPRAQEAPAAEAKARAALAAAVAEPEPEARAAAVAGLLRTGLPVPRWVELCRTFGTFAAQESGPSHQRVELHVLGKVEPTDTYLYTPTGYEPGKPAPLLLWSHGAGGTGAQEYRRWQAVADRLSMFVLAITEHEALAGYTFSPRERHAALAALRSARQQVDVDENAIFVGGISRGGHLTWDLVLRFPDLWAGAIPCIGGPRLQVGAQNNLRYIENVARLPLRDLQGSQDDPLLLANLRFAFADLVKAGAKDAELIEFADRGHDFDLAAVDWPKFLAVRRTAVPEVALRVAADAAEARAAWIEILAFEPGIGPEPKIAVDPAAWNRLGEAEQRRLLHERIVEKTARLRVQMRAPGSFVADSRGVRKFRLLLAAEMLGKDGAVEVRWLGRTIKKKAAPDARVLLREFVERFDRTFLPVAEVVLP